MSTTSSMNLERSASPTVRQRRAGPGRAAKQHQQGWPVTAAGQGDHHWVEMIQTDGDRHGLSKTGSFRQSACKLPVLWREPRDAFQRRGWGWKRPNLPDQQATQRQRSIIKQPEPQRHGPGNRAAAPEQRGATKGTDREHWRDKSHRHAVGWNNRNVTSTTLSLAVGRKAPQRREGNLGGDQHARAVAKPRLERASKPGPKGESPQAQPSRERSRQSRPASDPGATAATNSKLSCRPINRAPVLLGRGARPRPPRTKKSSGRGALQAEPPCRLIKQRDSPAAASKRQTTQCFQRSPVHARALLPRMATDNGATR